MARYLSCTRCKREISTANWKKHESVCYHTGLCPVWNKGKSSANNPELSESLKAGGQAFAAKIEAGFIPARALLAKTEEYRKAKSEWRKELHRTNPESHPNRKLSGNRSKMSYPEKVVFDLLTSLELSFEHQKQVEGFYPDFVLGNLIIEVDGAKWHDTDRDAKRDSKLIEAGYKVARFIVGPKLVERVKEFLVKEKLA